ncbi:MAG: hypothetical protein MJ175_12065 [Clostridia bacterium]|nr:hypothetical protein [Clostridia bacterium]
MDSKVSDKAREKAERKVAQMQKQWAREYRIAWFRRLLGKRPMQYKKIPVYDWNDRCSQIRTFRNAYADFFRSASYTENSDLQSQSTQLFWHRMYLQKLRMKRLGVTMDMESQRVKRSSLPRDSVAEKSYFDGRYENDEVNEAIYAKRTFLKEGKNIGTFRDFDSVNYSILSAKQQGPDEIVCPDCGNITTRDDLIDGCDFCGTKFSVEDISGRIGGFDFQIENIKEGIADKAREARYYFDEGAGNMVREYDPNFSFRNFRANVFNKMAAIHYADDSTQINAFSDIDLGGMREEYRNIVNIDFSKLGLYDVHYFVESGRRAHNNYYVEDGMQKIACSVDMVLFGLVDGKILLRNEYVELELEKSADCKTQNICGPSVFKCKGCGASLSLMDGKACPYCGRELDMRNYDWVITGYKSRLSDYGRSDREFN